MKTLFNGCAAVALMVGLAGQAHAEVVVREAPVHSVPADADAAPAMVMAPPAPVAAAADEDDDQPVRPKSEKVARVEASRSEAAPEKIRVDTPAEARSEPSMVKALTEKAPTPQALTPDETAFFAILGKRVTDAASAYETYVRRASAIDAHFGDAAAVQKAVRTGAAYQPQQLQEGIVAYAALLALRNEAFVEGVKSLRDPSFADRLAGSPQMVLAVRGSGEAAADVSGALRAQGAALLAAGKTITQAAYDVQAEGWSKTPVADPQTVLSTTKEAAAIPRAATVPAKERLLASLVDAPQAAVAPQSAATPDVVRGLALAALAIMGRTGDANEASFEALLHDATSADCLKMAKLNLNQCLAVAGPNYEDVYCTGRHAVGETATCVSAAANGAGPALPPAAPLPVQQRAEGYGPEQAQAYGQPGLQPESRDDDDRPAPQPPRYAAAPPAYDPAPAYTPPAARPAPPAYADSRAFAQNDQAYAQPAAPYQAPPAYAAQPPQSQYAQQPYPQPPQYQQPQYQQQAYAAPQQQPYPQRGYQATTPTVQYPYGYAARGYYGQ